MRKDEFSLIDKIRKEEYNQALEDFSKRILNWKPQDEEYRSLVDAVTDIKEELRREYDSKAYKLVGIMDKNR